VRPRVSGSGSIAHMSSGDRLGKKPIIEIFVAVREGGTLVVHFIYDVRIIRWAQSEAYYDEHYIRVGCACFRSGALVSHSTVPNVVTVVEYLLRLVRRSSSGQRTSRQSNC
jgi:hypothetical protein